MEMVTFRFRCLLQTLSVCLGLAAVAPLSAAVINNSSVSIIGGSPAYPGYEAFYAIDTGANQYTSDFAGLGTGVGTYLDFGFSQQYNFTSILYTDRTSSGAGNFSNFQGLFDYVTSFRFIFSDDPTFSSNNGIVTVNRGLPSGTGLSSLQQSVGIGVNGITGQYVRWEVLATQGVNPGAADFTFSGDVTGVPEPSSFVLTLLGGSLVLASVRRRSQRG